MSDIKERRFDDPMPILKSRSVMRFQYCQELDIGKCSILRGNALFN